MATLTPKLQRGDRVRAARTIRDGNRRHAIYQNTEGTVLFCGGGTATVQWDDSSIFVSVPLTALALTFPLPPATTQPGPLPARTVTELLRFESIQDLLTALGYEELQEKCACKRDAAPRYSAGNDPSRLRHPIFFLIVGRSWYTPRRDLA